MKYVNAKILLPDVLVKELQRYIQGGYVYVPRSLEPKRWGELSGYREELQQRNMQINEAYSKGISIDYLASQYSLSVYAIRKIIYQQYK